MSINKLKVSIILPVFNGSVHLNLAIKSLLSQTLKNFELIIIDDHSTDNSLKIIKKFTDKRIKLIVNSANLGLAASLNKAILISNADFIARMDQDDISYPNRIKMQLTFMKKNKIDLLGTWYQDINTQGKVVKTLRRLTSNQDLKKALLINTYFCHGSIMFTKKSWKKTNGYNTQYNYAEDYDFISKVSQLDGSNIENLPKILYYHRVNPKGMSLSKQKLQHSMSNKISKRNLSQWQQFYSFQYSQVKHSEGIKFQKQVSKNLIKVFFKKLLIKPLINEMKFYLSH